MKYLFKCTIFTLLSGALFSQSLQYKVIKDDPDDFANYWVNVGLLDFGFAFPNTGYGMLGVSLNSVAHYKNKFGGEFTYRHNYLSLVDNFKSKGFEIGGFYNLASKKKSRSQKVILSQSSNGKTTTTTSFKVPATIMRTYGVRAGFNLGNNGIEDPDKNYSTTGSPELGVKSAGLYAGVLMTSSVNMKTYTEKYSAKGAGFVRRNYIDIMFNPIINPFDASGNEYTGAIDLGTFGYRLGIEFLQPEPRKIQGTAMFQKFEIGKRPIDGYYMLYSLGFNFKRKVKSMSSFKVVREKE